MAYPPPISPTGPYLEMHDLATWILHAHATVIASPFATAKIVELNKNGDPFQSLSQSPEGWTNHSGLHRKVAYVLSDGPRGTPDVTLNTFVSPDFTPDIGTFTRQAVEDIFWRCKDLDQGSLLAHVAQCVFDTLAENGLWLRARTSIGYELVFNPTEIRLGSAMVTPREECLIIHGQPTGGVQISGSSGPFPWPYLVLGSDADLDRCVVLDLALPGIGGRGLGGEIFALERYADYMTRVLPLYAQVHSLEDLKTGTQPFSTEEYMQARGRILTVAVMDRIRASARTDDFCRHCGEPEVISHCTYCPANFCAPCYELGWRYHRRWCVPFRG